MDKEVVLFERCLEKENRCDYILTTYVVFCKLVTYILFSHIRYIDISTVVVVKKNTYLVSKCDFLFLWKFFDLHNLFLSCNSHKERNSIIFLGDSFQSLITHFVYI